MVICEHSACTGCGMCSNICPANAIRMHIGENGFLFPNVEDAKCIQCGLCVKRCPINNEVGTKETTRKVFACWNRNKKVRKKSTSGGIFGILANLFIEEKGVVVGVRWNQKFEAFHTVIENESELSTIRGSKYVQSNTGDIYRQVKKFLDDGRKVLFSGTPCQCHALRLFLDKEYDNLTIVDVVCHGVPSQQMLNKYIKEMTADGAKQILDINMRCKSPYWDYCNMQVKFSIDDVYSVPTVDDPFYTLFNIGYSLRNSCHECQYTNFKRISDITLMDFWGFIPEHAKMRDYNKGISGLLVNSDKGEKLFEQISSELVYEESTRTAALKANQSLAEPYRLDEDSLQCFWHDYENTNSVKELRDKYVKNPFTIPKNIFWIRLKKRYRWLKKK